MPGIETTPLCLKQAAAKQVKRAILFTNDNAVIGTYHALGFHQIGKYRLALLKFEEAV